MLLDLLEVMSFDHTGGVRQCAGENPGVSRRSRARLSGFRPRPKDSAEHGRKRIKQQKQQRRHDVTGRDATWRDVT